MKYNHIVKYNEVYYPAGAEVPVKEVKTEQPKTTNTDTKSTVKKTK